MISIIHPSRSRPGKSYFAVTEAWRKAKGDFETIVSVDSDDPLLNDYKMLYPETLIVNKNKSSVDAINKAAKKSKGEILIVLSDDTEVPEGWVNSIESQVKGKSDFILKTQDGIQPWIITNPILDRAYYNRFGYIYHPDYLHMFCDTEMSCVADITGRKITSNLLFKHNHYSVTKEAPDAINRKADSTWDQGEKLFLERYKRNFDLPPGKPIQDNGMINWLKRKVR